MSHEATRGRRSVLRIEQHSIDFIPESERHGKPWQQLPFWFGNGVGLTSAGIGFIGPSLGLGLAWSVTAVVTGMAFGTIFMALHANHERALRWNEPSNSVQGLAQQRSRSERRT